MGAVTKIEDIPLTFFHFENKFGDTFRYGSIIYYPIINLKSKQITVQKSKIDAFVFVKKDKIIEPMILTRAYLLRLDNVRKSYKDVEEVINKWESKIVEKVKETIVY